MRSFVGRYVANIIANNIVREYTDGITERWYIKWTCLFVIVCLPAKEGCDGIMQLNRVGAGVELLTLSDYINFTK